MNRRRIANILTPKHEEFKFMFIFQEFADQGGSHKCSQSKYHTHRSAAERCLW